MFDELYEKMEALLNEIIERYGEQEEADGAGQMMTLVKNYLEGNISAGKIDTTISILGNDIIKEVQRSVFDLPLTSDVFDMPVSELKK